MVRPRNIMKWTPQAGAMFWNELSAKFVTYELSHRLKYYVASSFPVSGKRTAYGIIEFENVHDALETLVLANHCLIPGTFVTPKPPPLLTYTRLRVYIRLRPFFNYLYFPLLQTFGQASITTLLR